VAVASLYPLGALSQGCGRECHTNIVGTLDGTPKEEHSYLLPNLLGRVSMFVETYLIDGLQTEASLQHLNIPGCSYLLAIERLCTPPNPKIAGD